MSCDEGGGGQIEDQTSIQFLVEVKIEIVERLLWVAKLCLFSPPLQQPIASTSELIRNEAGDQIEGRQNGQPVEVETQITVDFTITTK